MNVNKKRGAVMISSMPFSADVVTPFGFVYGLLSKTIVIAAIIIGLAVVAVIIAVSLMMLRKIRKKQGRKDLNQ
jgi:ABC-type uncharacterized transport system permease subunit